jgi:hypothetical protein
MGVEWMMQRVIDGADWPTGEENQSVAQVG